MRTPRQGKNHGFTLIELSIVLVIIGLIVGGVLVGQDLVKAAETRAQISQIEKFNTARNTFKVKYGYLPGDIPDPYASRFGFLARGTYPGEGDGNDVLESNYDNTAGQNYGVDGGTAGETAMLWVDLSTARMIEGSFTSATPSVTGVGSNNVGLYVPAAKVGGSNYIYVWSVNSVNYFGIASMFSGGAGPWIYSGTWGTTPAMTVQQAYNIDKKIDDGLPQTGAVTTLYVDYSSLGAPWYGWAGSGGITGNTPYTTATSGSTTTCFDNRGGSGPQQYSLEINKGAYTNCALSFKMQ